MRNRGLTHHWSDPKKSIATSKALWKKVVYMHLEEHYERLRELRSGELVTLARYAKVKRWGPMEHRANSRANSRARLRDSAHSSSSGILTMYKKGSASSSYSCAEPSASQY